MTEEQRESILEQLPGLFEQLAIDDNIMVELLAACESVLDDGKDPYEWGPDGRHTFSLLSPIRNMKGEEIHEITMRRGRLSDLAGVKLGASMQMAEIIKIAAKMCGTTPQRLGELTGSDVSDILGRARHFFTVSLGT